MKIKVNHIPSEYELHTQDGVDYTIYPLDKGVA